MTSVLLMAAVRFGDHFQFELLQFLARRSAPRVGYRILAGNEVRSLMTAGQEVVTAGAFKLRNGSGVTINNSVKAKPELSPHPENR